MFIYLAFFFACLISFRIKPKYFKLYNVCLVVLLGIFLSTGYTNGSDWRAYELWYDEVHSISDVISFSKERGFALLFFLGNELSLDFWHLWIMLKIFCFVLICKAVVKYSKPNENYGLAILFFYSYFALFYFIDNPMRNLIAASLFLFAYKPLMERKPYKYFLILFICSSFHNSAFFFAPLYFLLGKKTSNRKTVFIALASLYIVMFIFWGTGLSAYVNDFLINLDADYRGQAFLQQSGATISAGFVAQTLIYIFCLYHSDSLKENCTHFSFVYNMSIVYFITYILGFFVPILARLSMFCFVPYIVMVSTILYRARSFIVNSCVLLFLLLVVYKNITMDSRYIPYVSYLEYAFRDKPSYIYRSTYNPTFSPYAYKDIERRERNE